MTALVDFAMDTWDSLPAMIQYLTIVTWKILFVMIGVILVVAFSTYFERKVIGSMQARVGPNRVGPLGLGQPFADVIKLLLKEVIIPAKSNRWQRDKIVIGILLGSVVAKKNFTCSGGSSNVLSSALNASFVSM